MRELHNFTRIYMADELGLSIAGFGRIERNETDITISRLERITSILDTILYELILQQFKFKKNYKI